MTQDTKEVSYKISVTSYNPKEIHDKTIKDIEAKEFWTRQLAYIYIEAMERQLETSIGYDILVIPQKLDW